MHNRLVGCSIHDVVLECRGRLVALLIHREIINLHPEVHLLATFEYCRLPVRRSHARAYFCRTDYEHSRADAVGRDRLHVIGYDQRRTRQLVIIECRNNNPAAPRTHAVAVHVLHDNVQFVASRSQRHCFPINFRILHFLGKQFRRHVGSYGVFKRLCHLAGESREPAENVDDAMLYAVFVRKCNVAVLDLHRDRNQDRVAGDSHKISTNLERHQIVRNVRPDHLFQILKFDCRRLVQL